MVRDSQLSALSVHGWFAGRPVGYVAVKATTVFCYKKKGLSMFVLLEALRGTIIVIII
jgi:hypothetical protein